MKELKMATHVEERDDPEEQSREVQRGFLLSPVSMKKANGHLGAVPASSPMGIDWPHYARAKSRILARKLPM